jgi:hypothetical protein
MLRLTTGKEGESADPIPSAIKSRPPSADTMTRGSGTAVDESPEDGDKIVCDGAVWGFEGLDPEGECCAGVPELVEGPLEY